MALMPDVWYHVSRYWLFDVLSVSDGMYVVLAF